MANAAGSCWDSIHDSSRDHELVNVKEPELGIFVLVLNTPQNYNMLTPTMMGAFARTVDYLSSQEAEKVSMRPRKPSTFHFLYLIQMITD